MAASQSLRVFKVSDKVRVRSGVVDPDYDDLTIGGWAGAVVEVQEDEPTHVLVQWSEETLASQSTIYRNRCERDGFDHEEMWLDASDLEPDGGGPVQVEPQLNVVTKPLSMKNEDDRIRAVFGLTSDDPLPEADEESLVVYYTYLAEKLSFPFAAEYSFETGPFQQKTYALTVLGLLDPEDFPGDEYGLFCRARRGRAQIELPLTELDRVKRPNARLVADYSSWFVNS